MYGPGVKFDPNTGEPYLDAPGPSLGSYSSWLKSGVSFQAIRHRQWLCGFDLVRGELTVLASPGGVGKSSYATGTAVSLATGRELLGQPIHGTNLNVLYINAEDTQLEMRRRVWAFCLEHRVSQKDLNRLCLLGSDDWLVQRISFLQTVKGASLLDQAGVDFLEALIVQQRPDLIFLDPLVAFCGGGNMNDNAAMALVMRAIKRLAGKYDCAFLVIHHTRKGGDLSSAEAIGGASAIVNLARRAVMVVPMSEEEAKALGVLPSRRWRYLKLVPAKSNLAPPTTEVDWYELRSVTLPNAEIPIYPSGDSVQAIGIAQLPSGCGSFGLDMPAVKKAILDVVDAGKLISGTREPYSPSMAGAANARGLTPDVIAAARKVVGQGMPEKDVRAVVAAAVKELMANGALVILDPIGGKGPYRKCKGLAVDWTKTSYANRPTKPAPQPAPACPSAPAVP